MSFKEVKELRKSGKIDDALVLAQQDLEIEPENIWNKRSIAWVYYEYLKKYASPENYNQFKGYLEKLNSLSLPDDENMVFDNCAYQIGKIIFALQNEQQVEFSKLNEIFNIIKDFSFTKPSESYTFVYKAFHKGYLNWSNYLSFANWWNFDNFHSQDCLTEEYKGKTIMSLVEKAYIAYSKKILEGEKEFVETELGPLSRGKVIKQDQINDFLPKLDMLIGNHPEYQYPPYYQAKLLLAIGEKESVLKSFIPFAKKKKSDFWVWELMADVFPEDDERKIACLCKALSLKTPEDFLIKTREKLAYLLIAKGFNNEAKTEITKVFLVRKEKGWKFPEGLQAQLNNPNIKSAEAYIDNAVFYKKYIKTAEEILYHDVPEEIIAVEFVNTNKKMLNFIIDEKKNGYFKYAGFVENPKIGDVLKVRFVENVNDGYNQVFTIKRVLDKIEIPAIKEFKGNIKILETSNIGFVDNVFISSQLLSHNNISQDIEVKGKAILSFNKKKEEWGWKAYEINQ